MKLFRQIAKGILLIVIIIAIPLLFNLIFIGNESSHFLFIHSTLSVSDWFSFWASYISAIVSSLLAYAAISLSKTIELAHNHTEAEKNKQIFIVKNVGVNFELGDDSNSKYTIDISLPFEIQSLYDVKIIRAFIDFKDGKKIDFLCKKGLNGNGFSLEPIDGNLGWDREYLLYWKHWPENMTKGFETIYLNVEYSYVLNSFNYRAKSKKNICQTVAKYEIKVDNDNLMKSKTVNTFINVMINK